MPPWHRRVVNVIYLYEILSNTKIGYNPKTFGLTDKINTIYIVVIM